MTTLARHWASSSVLGHSNSKLLKAYLFSSTMAADTVQYAAPANTADLCCAGSKDSGLLSVSPAAGGACVGSTGFAIAPRPAAAAALTMGNTKSNP